MKVKKKRDKIYEDELIKNVEKMIQVLDNYAIQSDYIFNDYLAMERALQILVESFIGFSRYSLQMCFDQKSSKSVEALGHLYHNGVFTKNEYETYKKIVGFRNVLVHDYLNLDSAITAQIVRKKEYQKISVGLSQLQEILNKKVPD